MWFRIDRNNNVKANKVFSNLVSNSYLFQSKLQSEEKENFQSKRQHLYIEKVHVNEETTKIETQSKTNYNRNANSNHVNSISVIVISWTVTPWTITWWIWFPSFLLFLRCIVHILLFHSVNAAKCSLQDTANSIENCTFKFLQWHHIKTNIFREPILPTSSNVRCITNWGCWQVSGWVCS